MIKLLTDTSFEYDELVTAEPEDYTGEDGLLYCGKCRHRKKPTSRQRSRPVWA